MWAHAARSKRLGRRLLRLQMKQRYVTTPSSSAMAGGDSSPSHPPPAKRQNEPSTTTIHSLGDDLLLAIFLYLPSLAALVSAALTCRTWRRAVASSPEFRSRFRALHPPPLLGLFFPVTGVVQTRNTPAFPTFVAARRSGHDLAAAVVRSGDFSLTSLDDRPNENRCWYIADCRCGRVLLMNKNDSSLVLFNPLMPRSADAFDLGSEDLLEGCRGLHDELNPSLVFSDEDPTSFRVVLLAHDESRVRAKVFSSETREWSLLPWVDDPVRFDNRRSWLHKNCGMQANGFLYWAYEDRDSKYLRSLDMSTMEFSVSELPDFLKEGNIHVGETKDGATCIVYSYQLNVGILMHIKDNNGVERWVPDKEAPLDREVERVIRNGSNEDDSDEAYNWVQNPGDMLILTVHEGYAYLVTGETEDEDAPCCYMSLCLETMRLERLCLRQFQDAVHPYIMAWPSSLVGNYGF